MITIFAHKLLRLVAFIQYKNLTTTTRKKMKKTIVAFGNPLLDTTIYPKDKNLLKKYNFKEDDQCEISRECMEALTVDIHKYECHLTAGGCAQNTLRVMQWLTKKQFETVIFGSVGNDPDAETLKSLLENDGVSTRYITQQGAKTGKTVAIITGQSRTLVAYVGAAEILTIKDLKSIEDLKTQISKANFVYVEGFFLTKRSESAGYILNFCKKNSIPLIFGLPGSYVYSEQPELVRHFVDNSDVLLGNKHEFETLRLTLGLTDVTELLRPLQTSKSSLPYYGNTVVITDGPNTIDFIHRDRTGVVSVSEIPADLIKDTTGAGDAFTAGFIVGMCKGATVEECVKIGCYAAREIILQTGVTIPKHEPDLSVINC